MGRSTILNTLMDTGPISPRIFHILKQQDSWSVMVCDMGISDSSDYQWELFDVFVKSLRYLLFCSR